jgi:hypothetical protein
MAGCLDADERVAVQLTRVKIAAFHFLLIRSMVAVAVVVAVGRLQKRRFSYNAGMPSDRREANQSKRSRHFVPEVALFKEVNMVLWSRLSNYVF